MKKMTRGLVAGSALLAAGALQAGSVWSNDFSGASLDRNLSTSTQGAGASVIQTGGQLVLDTAVINDTARAQVFTQKDSCGATEFNGNPLYDFYNHQVSVSFNIASIAGTPAVGTGNPRNVFFFSIGKDARNVLQPGPGMDCGQGIQIEQLNTGDGARWRILGNSVCNGKFTQAFLYGLSAAPSAVTCVFNGTSATIHLSGATFTSGPTGVNGKSSVSVTFDDLSRVAEFDRFNLAFGAYNQGTVVEKTVVTLQAVSVGVEPPLMVGQSGPERYELPVIVSR